MDEKYDTDIFTEPTIRGKLGNNAMKANKHLYDHIVYDSTNEKTFAEKLDVANEVAVYVKLPDGFYISTPVGHYNPDWAIAFYEGNVKHIYFILKGDKTPTSIGGEWQQISLGGSQISFQDKASGGLQRCADVLCHAKYDAHLAASTPRRT